MTKRETTKTAKSMQAPFPEDPAQQPVKRKRGRPGRNSKHVTFRAPDYLAKIVNGQPNRSAFINECLENTVDQIQALSRLGDFQPVIKLKGELNMAFFDMGIKAGFPIMLGGDERPHHVNILQMLCPHPEYSYMIRVDGNSMIDANIYSGDIVIIDRSNRNPSPHQVAVCEYNGEYTLKHFVKRGKKGFLVPDNPDFPEIEISETDAFSVWGTVTYVIHAMR